jgi:hypothetical protein
MKIYKRKTALISGDLVLRDDQAEYSALLDAAKERRAGGARLKLIDAGRLSVFELEWLGLAGSELFTSDAVHRDLSDFILMIAATKKGGGAVAYFHPGPLAEIPSAATLQREAVRELARSGAFIYLSNKSAVRDADTLAVLADDARNGGSRLVYYHHGALSDDLEEAARRGAWIHVLGDVAADPRNFPLLGNLAAAAAAAGAGLVVHLERLVPVEILSDLYVAGAYLLFQTPPSDYRSPYRALEKKASRRTLDPQACYLYREFMR